MSPRAKHCWLAWLLPLFLLRAFVPAGFMLSWAGGELQVVVCSGSGPATLQPGPSNEHQLHQEHSHDAPAAAHESDHSSHHQGSSAHEVTYCPFALAGAAGAPTLACVFQMEPPASGPVDFNSLPQLRAASILIDRIRGPPHA